MLNVKSLVYKQGLYYYLAYIPESFFPILFLAYIPDGIYNWFFHNLIHCEILLMDSLSSISSMEEIILPDNAPPAVSHRDFLTEAECILFESMGVTNFCKSWIVLNHLVFLNAAVR